MDFYNDYQIYEFFFDLKLEFQMYRDSQELPDYGPVYAHLFHMPEELVELFWQKYIYPTFIPNLGIPYPEFNQNDKFNHIIDILEREYYLYDTFCPIKLSEEEFNHIYPKIDPGYRIEIARG
jgi:hypothetical protein